jgi:UDP-N-acetylglucosamine 1-carboxyvinyltransferase
MDMFVVEGGKPLRGTVRISGAKNACLPLMCAALLGRTPTTLRNVPDLRDIRSMQTLLDHVHVRVTLDRGTMTIDPTDFDTAFVPYDVMRKMRASMYAFGPMIARLGHAAVSMPGGCNIGDRPIDLHLRGFQALGVTIDERQGYIHAKHRGLVGADFSLRGAFGTSVGATANVLMAASLAKGRTIIRDAAREPEVTELANMLVAMGANISGIDTHTLTIEGVDSLQGVEWDLMPDRIEAGTFAVAALATDGDVILDHVNPDHLTATIDALRRWGAEITTPGPGMLRVRRDPSRPPQPLHLVAETYPGLPTDIQAPLVALLGLTPGYSSLKDTIYPDRFLYVAELNRLGADMRRADATVHVSGVDAYEGAAVMASDLRAGAALVVASLAAAHESQIRRVYHIDRGYERIERKLAALGASIRRTQEVEDDPGIAAVLGSVDADENVANETTTVER